MRPWLGGLLWLTSNIVVVLFGQFLFPQALVEDPSRSRTPSSVAVGCIAFAVLALLHWVYWRRVARHIRAVTASAEGRAAPTGPFALTRSPYRSILFGLGAGVLAVALLIVVFTISAFRSADSIDSPLLGLTYAVATVAPFGIGMTALGAAGMRRA